MRVRVFGWRFGLLGIGYNGTNTNPWSEVAQEPIYAPKACSVGEALLELATEESPRDWALTANRRAVIECEA
jgi:hypothetical protein